MSAGTAVAASPLIAGGIDTRIKVPHQEHPSIRAAPSNSLGVFWKYPRMIGISSGKYML
jgi:hypothetical protein